MIFYVYELCFPDGKAFYVGKGTDDGSRIFKRANCHWRKNQFVVKVISAMKRRGEKPLVKIVYESPSEDAAFDEEARRISLYGRRIFGGQLWNISDGGRQVGRPVGIPLTPEHKARISAANKGMRRSDESRERMRRAQLGKKHTPEHIRKVSEARRGRPCPEHVRRKIAAAQIGIPRKPASEETKLRMAQSQKIAWEKRRLKLSA